MLSIFDLDRTLTRKPTWSAFLIFSARRNAPWRLALIPVVLTLMLAYKARILTRKALKENMHRLMLGGTLGRAAVDHLVNCFADHVMATNVYDKSLTTIAAERAAGRRVIIASAAHSFYLGAIAARLGVEFIGTDSVWRGDCLSARIDSDNCYGLAKRDRLKAFLRGEGIDRAASHIRFFSDDVSDRPTFEWADEAIAVNATALLARLASRKGWSVYDWSPAPSLG